MYRGASSFVVEHPHTADQHAAAAARHQLEDRAEGADDPDREARESESRAREGEVRDAQRASAQGEEGESW